MELLKEFLQIASGATKGFVAVIFTNGQVNPEATYAFKNKSDADATFRRLKRELKGSDSHVHTEKAEDGTHIVIWGDWRDEIDELLFICFEPTKAAALAKAKKMINDGDVMAEVGDVEVIEAN